MLANRWLPLFTWTVHFRFIFFLVSLILLGCHEQHSDQIIDERSPLELSIDQIMINYYQQDSLNEIRRPVPPRIYYYISVINNTDTLYNLVLNEIGKTSQPRLYTVFKYGQNENDTLVITEKETFRNNKIVPNDTSFFYVVGWVPPILDQYLEVGLSRKEIMEIIANSGQLKYYPNQNDNELIESGMLLPKMEIQKSDSFRITYRDPNDYSIE